MRKYRDYVDQDIVDAVPKVKSLAGLLKELGLRVAGGNYANMKRNLQRLNLNCDHWTGQAWNKDERTKDWRDYSKIANLKKHLIKERGHRCQVCGKRKWRGKEIAIEVHHKDGNKTNNKLDNLLLVCPNCHAQTKTYRGKNK